MSFLRVLSEHMIDGVGQRGEFSFVDQFELFDEIDKVLKTRIEMRLGVQLHDLLYVVVVHMPIDSEQPLQDRLDDLAEVFGKRHPVLDREDSGVVDLFLDPGHEQVDVLRGRALMRFLVFDAVHPQILIFGAGRHHRARGLGAILRDDAVQQTDLIEKVHCVHRHPLVEVLPFRQSHRLSHVARTQCGRGILVQLHPLLVAVVLRRFEVGVLGLLRLLLLGVWVLFLFMLTRGAIVRHDGLGCKC